MKSIVIAALLGSISAMRLSDAPPYFNEPPFNQRHPAAGGFVQLETKTHCQRAGVTGVDCIPNEMLFATGLNGDEDLGQDIIMKGEKFHYNQWNPVVVKTAPGQLPVCHGTNGPDGVNCQRAVCDGTNGPKDGESGTPCTLPEPAAIPAYSTEPTAGQPYATTGNLAKPGIYGQVEPKNATATSFAQAQYPEPEKVHTLDPKIARTHTTFYDKK